MPPQAEITTNTYFRFFSFFIALKKKRQKSKNIKMIAMCQANKRTQTQDWFISNHANP